MVLNATGTAFPHLMGYALTEDFGVPHGMACAVFLPAFTRRAERFAPERAAAMFQLCGGRDNYISLLEALVRTDVRMTEEQTGEYAARWEGDAKWQKVPGGYSAGEGANLLRELFVP